MKTLVSSSSRLKLEQWTTYTLLRCLGEGGMGSVYEAIQHGADGFTKQVAIKWIHHSIGEKPEFLKNFVGEAKLVAQLVHTNIVQTYQLGCSDQGYFISMEYIHGEDLLRLLNAHALHGLCLPVPLAVFIASRVCRGLAYAHRKRGSHGKPLGIVHRDISPQNIMISQEGDVKITDFGMAKALHLMLDGEGEIIMGKVRYMSPEQAGGDRTDGRSDLFSLGIVLSEMLIGTNIFADEKSAEEKRKVLKMKIPDFSAQCPDIDRELSEILKKALSRDLDQRYQNAEAMLTDLERFIYSAGYGPTSETLAKYVQPYIEDANPPISVEAR